MFRSAPQDLEIMLNMQAPGRAWAATWHVQYAAQSKEGRKEILLMRATTKVDGHVNVLSEQINGPQLYRGKL